MPVPYNPFEFLSPSLLDDIVRTQKHFLVIQRFNWPGVETGKGFMITPYHEETSAQEHAEKLSPKEGRMIDLQTESAKVTALMSNPEYWLFLNTFRDVNWARNILKHYQRNIVSFLRTHTTISIRQGIDMELTFRHGRLKAIIQSKGVQKEFDAYELIK